MFETAIQQSCDVRRTLGNTHLEALPSSPGDADAPLALSWRTALLPRLLTDVIKIALCYLVSKQKEDNFKLLITGFCYAISIII